MFVRPFPPVATFLLAFFLGWGSTTAWATSGGGHFVPTHNDFCGATQVTIPVTVCNTHEPGTGVRWYGLTLHAGTFVGCDETFTPVASTTPASWGLGPGQCATFEVTLQRPSVLDTAPEACFWMFIDEQDGPTTGLGTFVHDHPFAPICLGWHFYEAEWARFIHPLDPVTQEIDVLNLGNEVVDLLYEVMILDGEGNPAGDLMQINGLEPGTPLRGVQVIEPGAAATIGFEMQWLNEGESGPFELVFLADPDLDGDLDPLGSIPLFNALSAEEGGTPGEDPTEAPPARSGRDLRLQIAPNPFNPATVVSFELTEPALASIEILDLRGRRVRQLLASQMLTAGVQTRRWDGRDDRGTAVASGIYQVRVRVADQITVKKALLLK